MAAKFYAVKRGTMKGIFRTWDECKACVDGYPNPVYKSFLTLEEAGAFMGWIPAAEPFGETRDEAKKEESLLAESKSQGESFSADTVRIYVDGSYHSATKEFSYGVVVLREGKEETFSRKFDDPHLASMHNVAGEIKGAEAAMQYAIDNGMKSIVIYHDYEGIAKWCTGAWKTNKEGTKAYKAFYENASKKVKISFQKVTGHSGDKYNDMADALAKGALGI